LRSTDQRSGTADPPRPIREPGDPKGGTGFGRQIQEKGETLFFTGAHPRRWQGSESRAVPYPPASNDLCTANSSQKLKGISNAQASCWGQQGERNSVEYMEMGEMVSWGDKTFSGTVVRFQYWAEKSKQRGGVKTAFKNLA